MLKPLSTPTEKEIKDFVSGTTTSLTVRVAATHAGIITKNNTFYLPDRMRKSLYTWTENYSKPVLVHHDENRDPVGRVMSAEYVDLSNGLTTKLTPIVSDSSVKDRFRRFCDGNMSYMNQVDFVRDVLVKDGMADDPAFEGLGYIQLTCQITDPDAIQKIRDGRYLTGSVSATTDRAVCSICKQDWMTESKCDHSPGEVYDGAKAFIIAGDFEYEEWSYVNKPADRRARTLEVVSDEVNDKMTDKHMKSKKVKDKLDVKSHADKVALTETHNALHYRFDYDVARQLMGKSEAKEEHGSALAQLIPLPGETHPVSKDIIDLHTKLHQEGKTLGIDTSFVLGALDGTLPEGLEVERPEHLGEDPYDDDEDDYDEKEDSVKEKSRKTMKDNETKVVPPTEEGKPEEIIDDFKTAFFDKTSEELEELFNKIDLSAVTDEQSDLIYELMLREVGEDKKAILADAKISTSSRKKMAGSTFCGPGRSFPVPDCSHVTAARRLIGRYKGGGSHSSILSCVARKAKAMGCGSGKDALAIEEDIKNIEKALEVSKAAEAALDPTKAVVETVDTTKTLVSEPVVANEIEEKFVKPEGCVVNCPCDALQAKLVKKTEKLKKRKAKNHEMEDQLVALRKEFQSLYKDIATMEDQLVAANKQLLAERVNRVTDRKLVSGAIKIEDVVTEGQKLMLLDSKSLNSQLESVDMTKIVDKINSGLSREPSGTISDPTKEIKDLAETSPKSENEPSTSPETIKLVRDTYTEIAVKKGYPAADKYLARMIREGYVVSKEQISK